jgi:hypothetical protein
VEEGILGRDGAEVRVLDLLGETRYLLFSFSVVHFFPIL